MPHDVTFEIIQLCKKDIDVTFNRPPKFFKCPNNHVYTFGNCTAPNEKGICPDCKLVMGYTGKYGELREGNEEIKDEVDENQPGYCL